MIEVYEEIVSTGNGIISLGILETDENKCSRGYGR